MAIRKSRVGKYLDLKRKPIISRRREIEGQIKELNKKRNERNGKLSTDIEMVLRGERGGHVGEIYKEHKKALTEINNGISTLHDELKKLNEVELNLMTHRKSHDAITILTDEGGHRIDLKHLDTFLRLNELDVPLSELKEKGGEYIDDSGKLRERILQTENMMKKYPKLFDKEGRMKWHIKRLLNMIHGDFRKEIGGDE